MNVGALIVLIEALKDIEIASGPIGPPAPDVVQTGEVKPMCGTGEYAYKVGDFWVCRTIPGGR